ncbi:hypothetical protein BsWGS_26064 [Bradybaena similaris]
MLATHSTPSKPTCLRQHAGVWWSLHPAKQVSADSAAPPCLITAYSTDFSGSLRYSKLYTRCIQSLQFNYRACGSNRTDRLLQQRQDGRTDFSSRVAK